MSLLDDVSIVVTPNGYKAGELYAVVPSSGAADMDVTRATDATRVNEAALIDDVLANVPRIDYTGGGCPHILAEPQRTNTITFSEDLNQASSIVVNATVLLNQGTSPKGDNSANKFTADTSFPNARLGVTTVINKKYTTSIFAKYEGYQFILLNFTTNFNNGSSGAWFDILNGTIGTTQSDVTFTKIEQLSNNWYRISITSEATSSGTGQVRIHLCDTDGSSTITGTTGLSNFVWGFQIEEGSFVTSLIPTSGSTVTRNQDQFTRDGIVSLINSEEGTLVIEPRYFINDGSGTGRKIAISDGTSNNRIYITPYQGLASRIRYIFTNGGATQADLQVTGIDITISRKLAFVWKANRFELWQNGSKISEDTSGTTPSAGTFNEINLSSELGNGAEPFEGELKQLQVYKTALTDTQLAALTS